MARTIRFLHTADIHLGAKFLALGSQAAKQREQLLQTFNRVIELAIEQKVDFVLLAGDTFDSNQPAPKTLDAFKQGIKQLARFRIPAVIIGGTHDYLSDQSVLAACHETLQPDLILLDEQTPVWRPDHLPVEVMGISLSAANMPSQPIEELNKISKQDGRLHIGMVHGSLDIGKGGNQEAQFTTDAIAASGLDYLALGHWHNAKDYSQGSTTCWYPGSPEMIAMDEKERGQVLLVDLTPDHSIKVNKQCVGKRTIINHTIDVNQGTEEDILAQLAELADEDAILRVTLNGLVPIERELHLDDLKAKLDSLFFYYQLSDLTRRQLSQENLGRFDRKTIIGQYVDMIKQDMARADQESQKELEEVMQLGVALIQGQDIKLWS